MRILLVSNRPAFAVRDRAGGIQAGDHRNRDKFIFTCSGPIESGRASGYENSDKQLYNPNCPQVFRVPHNLKRSL